ncbi:aldehyde dehydrogenase family protein [Salipiger sp. P9]|uniref:aldehyde dehydrogenase family protein n=1 Tax=Salipiger pentaromativorans TaxID=2943193 RepID=UPI002158289F|nr:aldehyde dehydrogenase family protein [Salipiger pentaromativorans]MCR8549255.1 aldehyde dehydrogenase family protein [Salipiger pentaromativorans]
MTTDRLSFYIDGAWRAPAPGALRLAVENPATERSVGAISLGGAADVDAAVRAARQAFGSYSRSPVAQRIAWLEEIGAQIEARLPEMARAISLEMGAPITFAREVQAGNALAHVQEVIGVLRGYAFEHPLKQARILHEPIGVCGLITAWNWPVILIMTKLVYALGAGCTVVLKPSEIAPLSAAVLADAIDATSLPEGVFNLVNGDGAGVGRAISAHPGVDLVSFTGSTRAGIDISKTAADTVKRVLLELGGKSANIILPDADLRSAVDLGIRRAFANSGQSCQAPTRMLVHESQMAEAVDVAREVAAGLRLGDPSRQETEMGPVVSRRQYERIQSMIESGIASGARLVAGGPGKPEGLETGHYVRPTVFARVDPGASIAQDEIFGPVLPIIPYRDDEEAVEIANGTIYGLASYIHSGDEARAMALGRRMQSGRVYINTYTHDLSVPFGGYKQSGNGREQGVPGLEEYLEVKTVLGCRA